MARDYYADLGVAREASPEDIKSAFRRLARESHPDANPGDPAAESRFRHIAEAYEVLSDVDRRRSYDRGETLEFGDLFAGFGGLDDLIRSVFGDGGFFNNQGGRPASNRGRDVLVGVEVDLASAAFGGETEVSFRTRLACESCGGEGSAPGTSPITCPSCGGAGTVRVARRGLLGTMMTLSPCTTCAGHGTIVSEPCPACRGAGAITGDTQGARRDPGRCLGWHPAASIRPRRTSRPPGCRGRPSCRDQDQADRRISPARVTT